MHARIGMSLAAISVTSVLFLTGLPWDGFAASIDLSNDVSVGWGDGPNCNRAPALCDPATAVLVEGAPRFVPDASNAVDSLKVSVQFFGVTIDTPGANGLCGGCDNNLYLNVGDAALNEVFRSDGSPLLLHTFLPTHPYLAENVTLTLRDFDNSELLPPGDLFFTVTWHPDFVSFSVPDGTEHAARVDFSGPGTVVPEPSTLVLLLSGLTSLGIGAGWRSIRERASHQIG
jgi:hypothetical protein